MARKVELEPELVLKAIYNAATDAIDAHGVENITIRDVCQRAGISTGKFYHFYPTKQHLLNRMIDHMENYYRDEVVPALHGDPLEKLDQLILSYIKRITRRGLGYARRNIVFANDGGLSIKNLQDQYRWQAFLTVVTEGQKQGLIKTDVNGNTLVSLIFTFMQGLTIQWCQTDGEEDIFLFLNRLQPVFIDSIKNK